VRDCNHLIYFHHHHHHCGRCCREMSWNEMKLSSLLTGTCERERFTIYTKKVVMKINKIIKLMKRKKERKLLLSRNDTKGRETKWCVRKEVREMNSVDEKNERKYNIYIFYVVKEHQMFRLIFLLASHHHRRMTLRLKIIICTNLHIWPLNWCEHISLPA
jgi:hypothetical protein